MEHRRRLLQHLHCLRAQPAPRHLWLALIPVLLLPLVLTLPDLMEQPVYRTELYSIGHVDSPTGFASLGETLESVAVISPQHTPFYFVLLNGWARLFGWNIPALRVLSLLFAVLLVAWTYRLGRDTASPYVGLYGAALTAACMVLVEFSQRIRMYTLLPLLTVIVDWLYLHIMTRRAPVRWYLWLVLFVGASALLYTHIFGIFLLGAVGLWHLTQWVNPSHPRVGRWWAVSIIVTLAGLTFIGWLPVILAGRDEIVELDASPVNPARIIQTILQGFGNNSGVLVVVSVGLALLALVRRERGAVLLWLLPVGVIGLIVIANTLLLMFTDRFDISKLRYFMGLLPLIGLLLGLGLSQVNRWQVIPLAAFGLFLLAGLAFYPTRAFKSDRPEYARMPPIQQIAPVLAGHAQPGDVLVLVLTNNELPRTIDHGSSILGYYMAGIGLDYLALVDGEADDTTAAAISARIDSADAETPAIWLLYDPQWESDPVKQYRQQIGARRVLCGLVFEHEFVRVEEYRLPGECPDS